MLQLAAPLKSVGHACPALCRVGVGLNDVLLGPRPSLPRLRRKSLFFVVMPLLRGVGGYYRCRRKNALGRQMAVRELAIGQK